MKRKDNETFTTNEFNKSNEMNSFYRETYSPLENIGFYERKDFKEENEKVKEEEEKTSETVADDVDKKTDKQVKEELKSKVTKAEVKPNVLNDFKDRIIESTAPLRTIVSAATCTVAAAAVATTTILTTPPKVENVTLESGNDYVQYSLNIKSLDLDSKYLLQVINPDFDYKEEIDLEKADSLEYIDGFVKGLKPNRRYEFKLLRDNGEVGGYSDYYSKTFYTLKPADPTVLFDFAVDDNKLEYTTYISDVYNVCENTYLTYEINGTTSDKINIDEKEKKSTIDIIDESSIYFEVYSTLYGEEKLLSSYKYNFTSFNGEVIDNTVKVKGHLGEEYKLLKGITIELITYDEKDEILDNITKDIDVTEDIETDFELSKDFISYSFSVNYKETSIYTVDKTIVNVVPEITFNDQCIIDEGLKVETSVLPLDSVGYINTVDGTSVSLIMGEDYFIIPLYDNDGNRYSYNDYEVTINDYRYTFVPNMNLLDVNDMVINVIDGQAYLETSGFTSLNTVDKLKIELLDGETIVQDLILDNNKSYQLDVKIDMSKTYKIISYLVNDKDEITSDKVTKENLSISTIDIISSFEQGKVNLEVSGNALDKVSIEVISYNNDEQVETSSCELVDENGVMKGSSSIGDEITSIAYKVKLDGYEYQLDKIDFVKFGNQEIVDQGVKVKASNITANSKGTIKLDENISVDLIIEGDSIIVPLYDDSGNKYTRASYELFIDGIEYTFVPDTQLLVVDNLNIDVINDKAYLKVGNYESLYEDSMKLKVEIFDEESKLFESIYVDERNKSYLTTLIVGNNNIYSIEAYLVDNEDTVISSKYIQKDVTPNRVTITSSFDGSNLNINMIGNVLDNVTLDIVTYDANNGIIDTTSCALLTSDIGKVGSSTIDDSVSSISYKVNVNGTIYETEKINHLIFGEQELSDEGLIVNATNIKADSVGTINTIDGTSLNLIMTNESITIPLYDDNGNKYNFDNYELTIDGYDYSLELDDKLLKVNDSSIYSLNGKLYLFTDGYEKMTNVSSSMIIEIKTEAGIFKTITLADDVNKYFIVDGAINESNVVSIDYYLVDDSNTKTSYVVTQSNVSISDTINSEMSCNLGTLDFVISAQNQYTVNISYFDKDDTLITKETASVDYTSSTDGKYSKVLDDAIKYISYQIVLDDTVLYESEEFERLDVTLSDQTLSKNGTILTALGVDETMTGTIKDVDSNVINLIIEKDKITIPRYNDQYQEYTFDDYTITLSNSFETREYNLEMKEMLVLSNVSLVNAYSGKGVSFENYIFTSLTDYILSVGVYINDELQDEETFTKSNNEIYDSMFVLSNYFNTANFGSNDYTIKISMLNVDGEAIPNVPTQEFVIAAADQTISGNHTFSALNPSDYLITYNDDGTINMYGAVNFSADNDPKVKLKVTLNDDIIVYTQDKILSLENYQNTNYAIRYQIVKESTSMTMVFEDVNPSGTINEERGIYLMGISSLDNSGVKYADIDISSYIDDDYDSSTTFFEDHEATFDDINKIWRVKLGEEDNSLKIHIYLASENYNKNIGDIKNINPDFSPNGQTHIEYIIDVSIQN